MSTRVTRFGRTTGPGLWPIKPDFGPGIKERLAWASTITQRGIRAGSTIAKAHLSFLFEEYCSEGDAFLLPTAPGIAPLRGTPAQQLEDFRNKALQLLCIAGLAGLPQISMPVASLWGCPMGLSVMSSTGNDFELLDFCCETAELVTGSFALE